ncbi:MAG: hypothetical protein K0S33_1622 [Bacteroidetes bacterium]|jgi:hypothetical protein|nr:hypothetical protein [Bacteroidota bacterium]
MGRISKYVYLLSLGLAFFCSGCKEPDEERFTPIKQALLTFEDSASRIRCVAGSAASGSYYAHTDTKTSFGPAFVFQLPDSVVHKSIRVCIEADIRKEKEGTGQTMAVLLKSGNQTLVSYLLDMNVAATEEKTWVHIIDSTEIPVWVNTTPGSVLEVYGYNTSPRSYMDYDNLKVTCKTVDYISKKQEHVTD